MKRIAVVENGIVFIKNPNSYGYIHRLDNRPNVQFVDLNDEIEKLLLTYRDGRVQVTSLNGGSYGWMMVDDAILARWIGRDEILVQHRSGRDTVHSLNGFGIKRYL